MAEQVNKRIAGLARVKARAALRVRQRFAQIEVEKELKEQEDKAVKAATEAKEERKPVVAKVSPVKKKKESK